MPEDLQTMTPKMNIRLIAAMSRNHVIGKRGRLPWSIPEVRSLGHLMTNTSPVSDRTRHVFSEDFAYFLEAVRGDVCITGRKCYAELGSAIPGAGKMFPNATVPTMCGEVEA